MGCSIGPHTTDAQATEFWKSNTVSHAEVGAKKAEIANLRSIDDFNKKEA